MSSKVTDRYIELLAIRDKGGYGTNLKKWIKKSKLIVGAKDTERSDYRTHTSRAVSDQQKSDLLHNNPIYDFIGLNKDGRKQVFTLKEAWKYWWKIDETDSKIYDVVSDAGDLGSGYLYQGWRVEKRKVSLPKYNKTTASIDYKNEEVEQYVGPYSKYIPMENILFDGTTIENSNEAIWIDFWDRDEYIKAHELNTDYNTGSIPKYDTYYNEHSKLPKLVSAEPNLVAELRYYNKSADTLIIEANGQEVYSTPIPHLHKDLPFCKYDNHNIRDRMNQMGNFELLEEQENYLDAVRSQSIDVTKANIGYTIVPKDSAFEIRQEGTFAIAELDAEDINSIKYIGSNIQPGQLSDLEKKGGDDVTMISGVNHRSQLLDGASEAATKTNSRNNAQAKRINLILKKNSFKFYNRLAKLRLNDMILIHSMKEFDVSTKGINQTGDNEFKSVGQNGYGLFTIKPEMLTGKFNIVLQTESLLGDSTSTELEQLLRYFQVFGNVKDENGKPIFNLDNVVTMAGRKFGIDVEELMASNDNNKDGEQLIEEALAEAEGKNFGAANPSNPSFIPGANKANDSGGINVLGGGNTASEG